MENIKHLIVVDQDTVTKNYPEIPFYMHLWDKLFQKQSEESYIRDSHSFVYVNINLFSAIYFNFSIEYLSVMSVFFHRKIWFISFIS